MRTSYTRSASVPVGACLSGTGLPTAAGAAFWLRQMPFVVVTLGVLALAWMA